jgi:hypothetical protein
MNVNVSGLAANTVPVEKRRAIAHSARWFTFLLLNLKTGSGSRPDIN